MSAEVRPSDEVRDLRRRLAESANGGVELDRAGFVSRLAPGSEGANGDDPREVARYAQRLLMFHGLRARPRVDDVAAPKTTLVLDRGLAIQGAVVITTLGFIAGAAASPLYGVLLGIAGAIGVAIVALRFNWLARRAPEWVPRGRTLGVAVAIPLTAVMFVAAVLPIHHARANDKGNPGFAASLLAGARQSIAAGDVKTAEDRVVQASFADPGNPDLANVRDEIVVARMQKLLDDQNRKDGIYDRAERAYRAHHVTAAIALMSSIKGFRDADQRVADYRAGRP